MDTRQRLEAALKDALRSGDDMRKQNVRMIMSAIKLSEVEKGTKLDDAAVIAVVQKELKSRQEALLDAEKAKRPDLMESARTDISFLESFLPRQLTAEEITEIARETIGEIGATGPADMGRVMKAMMPKVQGRAAGDQVSQAVRSLLQS